MRLLGLLVALFVAGCPVPPPQSAPDNTRPLVPPQPPGPPPPGFADGQSCTLDRQCASGVCEGAGCTDQQPGICVPAQRACTRDLRPYCGCDGATFEASGSCPGHRYAHKGSC